MSHRRRTKAGLVGEHAAFHAPSDNQNNRTYCTACHAFRGESAGENFGKHSRQIGSIVHQHDHACHNVYHSHEGNQLLRHRAQTLNAAEQNDCGQHHQNQTQHHIHCGLSTEIRVKGKDYGVDRVGDIAHLNRVTDAKGGQSGKDTEDSTQPLPIFAQTVLDVVHRAAYPVAILILFPELHRQKNLGIFGGHTNQSCNPQPKDGARAAQGDRGGDTRNVTGAHRAGQRRTHRLEGSNFAFFCFPLLKDFTNGVLHGIAELPELDASVADGQQNAAAHQKDQHGDAPDKAIDCTVNTCDQFHANLSFSQFSSLELQMSASEITKRSAARPQHSVQKFHSNRALYFVFCTVNSSYESVLLPESLGLAPSAPAIRRCLQIAIHPRHRFPPFSLPFYFQEWKWIPATEEFI